MNFLRGLYRLLSGLTQFALYSALFFVLMVGAGYWVALQFFGGEEVQAPDLTGLSMVQALEKLQPVHVSLQMERLQPHVQVPQGHIISQYPSPGAVIKAGTPIRVAVSKGSPLVTVPDLRGRNKIEAGIRLRKLGLNVGVTASIPHSGVSGGTVLTTDPPAGTGIIDGSTVNLLLAAGEGARISQMPNLIGLTRDEAGEVLASYGLSLAESREDASGDPNTPAGHIHAQTPAPGEPIAPNTRITITCQPAYSEQPTTATTTLENQFPKEFYRGADSEAGVFRGADESKTFRGEEAPAVDLNFGQRGSAGSAPADQQTSPPEPATGQ